MTSSGVPVGDTTLLAGLRQTAADHENGEGLLTAQFTQLVDALPAVVTLIEAAQEAARILRSLPDLQIGDSKPAELLEDGLAPFVGEATQ